MATPSLPEVGRHQGRAQDDRQRDRHWDRGCSHHGMGWDPEMDRSDLHLLGWRAASMIEISMQCHIRHPRLCRWLWAAATYLAIVLWGLPPNWR